MERPDVMARKVLQFLRDLQAFMGFKGVATHQTIHSRQNVLDHQHSNIHTHLLVAAVVMALLLSWSLLQMELELVKSQVHVVLGVIWDIAVRLNLQVRQLFRANYNPKSKFFIGFLVVFIILYFVFKLFYGCDLTTVLN